MRQRLILATAAAAALFHLYISGVAPFTALVQRPIHLALMAVMGFLGLGVIKRAAVDESSGKALPPAHTLTHRVETWIGWGFAVVAVASAIYLAMNHEALVRRAATPTSTDLLLGMATLVVVLELTRRTTGWALVTVCMLALLYGMLGPHLPGLLAHRGYGVTRLVEHLYLTTEGIWGIPLGVSADFVYLFILFGAILEVAGGGALLMGLAERVAGNTRGGPAKTSVVASALFGSLSGSAVANVVTTGAFTIPIMKRNGYKPHFAGAVEAAASTGGQFMPPIMGAGAFIMATWIEVPYLEVALAATIPALLYYGALLAAVHFRACRMGITAGRIEDREAVLPRLHLLLPLVAIVMLLAMGRSPMRAAFWGVMSAFVIALLRPATRLGWTGLKRTLLSAGGGAVQVAAACAAAGIVVGVASLTGIGLRMSEVIIALAGGQLLPALVLTAMGSLILGMGLPTTAAYIVLAALGAPALVELGVPLIAAHLFIFYFGCISNVTPPVALAAYAGAGIAGAAPMLTAGTASVLASAGFIVPFMFVYGPAILLQGSWYEVVAATVSGMVGVIALGAATMGYARRPLSWWERCLLGAFALCLIKPGLITDGIGFLGTATMFAWGPRTARAAHVSEVPVVAQDPRGSVDESGQPVADRS